MFLGSLLSRTTRKVQSACRGRTANYEGSVVRSFRLQPQRRGRLPEPAAGDLRFRKWRRAVQEDRLHNSAPVEELLALPFLQLDQVKDSLHANQLSKGCNSLRVMAEAVRGGKRGARVNTISTGILVTPLANDELTGPRGAGCRRMMDLSPAGRAGTPDEVGTVGYDSGGALAPMKECAVLWRVEGAVQRTATEAEKSASGIRSVQPADQTFRLRLLLTMEQIESLGGWPDRSSEVSEPSRFRKLPSFRPR